jgi:hypothetical protein
MQSVVCAPGLTRWLDSQGNDALTQPGDCCCLPSSHGPHRSQDTSYAAATTGMPIAAAAVERGPGPLQSIFARSNHHCPAAAITQQQHPLPSENCCQQINKPHHIWQSSGQLAATTQGVTAVAAVPCMQAGGQRLPLLIPLTHPQGGPKVRLTR